MEYLGCHAICYNAICCDAICCDWTCDSVSQLFMFNRMLLCLDSISFTYWLNLIRSSLTTRSNYFLSIDLSEFSLITYYLLLIYFNYLDSDVLPFTSTWKMAKDTPNQIPKNMIGYYQTSREILEDDIS